MVLAVAWLLPVPLVLLLELIPSAPKPIPLVYKVVCANAFSTSSSSSCITREISSESNEPERERDRSFGCNFCSFFALCAALFFFLVASFL